MGEAKCRGTFEQRKAEAIKAGRILEIRRKKQAEARAYRRYLITQHLEFLKKLQEEFIAKALTNR